MSPRPVALVALLVGGCALLDFDPASRPYQDAGARVDAATVGDVVTASDVPCPAPCPTGLSCVNGACGCPVGLRDCGGDRATRCQQCCRHADCDDGNGCTRDRCENSGRCVNDGCAPGSVCCDNTRCCQGACSGGRCM